MPLNWHFKSINLADKKIMKITDVFTPRNHEVNLKMYVPRLEHETALLRAIQGTMHCLIFGESGNGKSWLYKKVLDQNKIIYVVANCANATRSGSIQKKYVHLLFR